jgi:hypothetical protein
MSDLVEVFVARDIAHAHILKGALEEEGIPANVTHSTLHEVLGEAAVPGRVGPQVFVREEDLERAVEILERLEGPAPGHAPPEPSDTPGDDSGD